MEVTTSTDATIKSTDSMSGMAFRLELPDTLNRMALEKQAPSTTRR